MTRKRNLDKDVVISSASAAAAAQPRHASTAKRTPRSRPAAESPATPVSESEAFVETAAFVAEYALSHDEIARLAYSMWQARGCQNGNPEEDWRQAEEELRRRALATKS